MHINNYCIKKYVNNDYVSFILLQFYMKCFNINCPSRITCLSFLFFLDTLDLDEARDAIEDILSSLSLLMAMKFSLKSRNGEIF